MPMPSAPAPTNGIDDLVVEEHIDAGDDLIGVVLADHALAGLRVVGLADAGQQQQARTLCSA